MCMIYPFINSLFLSKIIEFIFDMYCQIYATSAMRGYYRENFILFKIYFVAQFYLSFY